MNRFRNMTPAMIDARNAHIAQRRSDYAKENPFSEPGKCQNCDGKGWYATGETDNPVQLQCRFCSGTGKSEPGKAIPAVESVNPPTERESKLHDQILAYCAKQWPRWKVIHCRTDKKSTIAVAAHDFTIFMPLGQIACIECKAKGRKLTQEQQAWAKEMEMLGHCVYTIWSFADFESILRDRNLI